MKDTIIYIGGFELPDKNAAAQRVLGVAKIIRELGYNVVLVGVDRGTGNVENILDTRGACDGFETWSIQYPKSTSAWLNYITSVNQIDSLLEKEYQNRVFSMICYNYPAIGQYKIRRLAYKHKALAIADVTEWYSASGKRVAHKIIKWLDTLLRMQLVNFMMDGLITTSSYLSYVYRKKVIVELPTLYDKRKLQEKTVPSSIEMTFIPRLIYAGSPFDVKEAERDRGAVKERLDLIIQSLYEMYTDKINFQLDIFGLSREDYLRVYPEHRDKLDTMQNIVEFQGRVPHELIIERIAESDFSIFLRDVTRVTKAGFPSKFSESITVGTPVITNLMSNIKLYAVEGKNCFFVDIDNANSLNKSMKFILQLSRKDISGAKNFCKNSNMFDYRSFAIDVDNFFNRLLQK